MEIYEPRNKELWALYDKGDIDKSELNRLRYIHPLAAVGHPDEALAAQFCVEALARIPYKNVLLPGALDLLGYLYPRYEMFILSNGFTELQAQKMRTTGIDKYFKKIIPCFRTYQLFIQICFSRTFCSQNINFRYISSKRS